MNILEQFLQLLQILKQSGVDLSGQSGQSQSDNGGLVFPVEGQQRITQGFGNYNPALYGKFGGSGKHLGVDLATSSGTLVKSPVSGTARVGYDPNGYGQFVEIVGDDGTSYRVSHLSALERALERGPMKVKAGQTIAKTGGVGPRAGNSTGAHLDYSVKRNGQYIDPLSMYQRG